MIDQQKKALQQIKQIVEENHLNWEDVRQALQVTGEDKVAQNGMEASAILAYIGGILIFAGIGIYTTMFWQDFSSFSKIALTFGSGFSCYCIALGLFQKPRYIKVTQTLFLIAAILQPTGLYVFLNQTFVSSSDVHGPTLFVFGIMLAQQLVTFWQTRLNLLLFDTLFFGMGFIVTLFDDLDIKTEYTLIGLGISLFLIIYSLESTPYRPLTGFWYFMASAFFLGGAYAWLYNTPFEIFFVGLCVFTIYLSTITKSKVILFISTMGLLGYIGHYTMLHFVNSIGWPISLIIIGACFILLSGFALRINKKYM